MISRYLLLIVGLLFATHVAAQGPPSKCYFLDGGESVGSFRCNNATSGHSSCCSAGGICYSNGVCAEKTDGLLDYLRVGCTDQTWNDPACLAQCTAIQNNTAAGIRFCNGVTISDTTQYCCDPGGRGVNSFECCKTPTNIFRITPAATVIAQIPLDFTFTSAISSPSSTRSASPSSSAAPAVKFPEKSTNGTSVAIGVAIPIAVLAIIFAAFLSWRRRKNIREAQGSELPSYGSSEGNRPYPSNTWPEDSDSKGYYAGRKYSNESVQELDTMHLPQKAHSPAGVYEMGPGR